MDLLKGDNNGFVVDPLTLHSICRLGIQEAVVAATGRLGITESCLDLFRSLIEDRQLHQGKDGYLVLAKRGDEYVRQEITKEDIDSDIRQLQEIVDWAAANCEILPAVGTTEPESLARQMASLMDPAFTDCLLAASGSGRHLLSDDQRLRAYAKEFWNVDGVWVQPVLLTAGDRGLLSIESYCDATVSLIEADVYFTTIDGNVLKHVVNGEGWVVTDKVRTVVATLGGEDIDLRSSFRVIGNFLQTIWRQPIWIVQREGLTFALINALTDRHDGSTPALLEGLVALGDSMSGAGRAGYLAAIEGWCFGHFLEYPPNLASSRFPGRRPGE